MSGTYPSSLLCGPRPLVRAGIIAISACSVMLHCQKYHFWFCHLGPVRTTQIFVCFAKKSVNTKPFVVRTIFFTHQNFRKRHQTSKMPSTRFGGCKNFVRRGNPLFLDIHPSSGHQLNFATYRDIVTVWIPAILIEHAMDPHRINMNPWYLNYYGSQCYQDQDQGNQSYYDSQMATQQEYFLQFPSQQSLKRVFSLWT